MRLTATLKEYLTIHKPIDGKELNGLLRKITEKIGGRETIYVRLAAHLDEVEILLDGDRQDALFLTKQYPDLTLQLKNQTGNDTADFGIFTNNEKIQINAAESPALNEPASQEKEILIQILTNDITKTGQIMAAILECLKAK